MVTFPLTKKIFPDKYWLKFADENGILKYVDLSGCANNFSRATGYKSKDDLQAIGWQYISNDQLCFELFNVGHTLLTIPVQPGPIQALSYLLSGKSPQQGHREFIESFEKALALGGWKIVKKDEVTP